MDSKHPRVLHVIRRLDIVGGAERIVVDLVRNEPRYDVLVFDGADSFFNLEGKNIIRAKNIMHALWLCLRLRDQYTKFHLHLFPAIYFALLLGKKSIIHEHNTHNARRNHLIFRPVEWLVYRRANAILTISDAAKSALQSWIGKGPKIHVIPNFVSPLLNSQDSIDFRDLAGQKHVVMVASFTTQKRQDLLIRSLLFLPDDFHVSFAGTGPTIESHKNLVKELGLSSRVSFLGAVSDVSALYARADLCVLVSHWEGFGLVVIEAAQCGVPTLVSDVNGLRDICPDSSLLFKGENPSGLAAQIRELLSSKDPIIGAQELQAFASKFSKKGYLDRLENLYAN